MPADNDRCGRVHQHYSRFVALRSSKIGIIERSFLTVLHTQKDRLAILAGLDWLFRRPANSIERIRYVHSARETGSRLIADAFVFICPKTCFTRCTILLVRSRLAV